MSDVEKTGIELVSNVCIDGRKRFGVWIKTPKRFTSNTEAFFKIYDSG